MITATVKPISIPTGTFHEVPRLKAMINYANQVGHKMIQQIPVTGLIVLVPAITGRIKAL
jgi:hypothetical protein